MNCPTRNSLAGKLGNQTWKELHQHFNQSHPEGQVSYAKFAMLRPSHVKTKQQAKYNGCLCEYCEKIHLQLNSVNAQLSTLKSEAPHVKDIYHLTNITLCETHTPDGLIGHHVSCETVKIVELTAWTCSWNLCWPRKDKKIQWKRWELEKSSKDLRSAH